MDKERMKAIKKMLEHRAKYCNSEFGTINHTDIVRYSDILDLINEQDQEIKKLKARRYIITPKKRSPVEEILIQRNSPFVVTQADFEITPIPTKEEIQTETAKEILFDLFGYVGSAQQFVITNDGNKTLIDCDKLFDYMGKVANKYGVEVEE